ncbi:MAG: hypothetical protein QGG67_07865 [Gammaproteobacteria bacterium]|jgi:hypothetical protein|nr:hypothetical protein [Gammaproteobacteria bacterium]MDP7316414.1 hypothetical protein [Pseudomonadales bacterium]|tara:strand:+ start:2464 stop:2958 length:495 start_codon:yes stop_codon:yes gene_type:complete
MSTLRSSFIAVVCLTFAASGWAGELSGTSLSKKEVSLPDGNVNIVIAGFSRDSGKSAEEWRQALSDIEPSVSIYTMVDLKEAPRFVRGMIVRSLRGDTPEEAHDTFLIVTDSSPAWRHAARVDDESQVYVLKLAPGGEVCKRLVGPVSDTAINLLLKADCRPQE